MKLGEIVGTWRLISVGLEARCTYVGHLFTRSLWNCQQTCLSNLRCNTINFRAEIWLCEFLACSPGSGYALRSGVYELEPAVYTWLSAPGKAAHLLCGTHAEPCLHAHTSTSPHTPAPAGARTHTHVCAFIDVYVESELNVWHT